MLELLLSGSFGKSATVTPSTYTPRPGDTVTFTVRTKGITNERIYWSVLSNGEITTGFSPQQSSTIPASNTFTFNIVMPTNEINNNKTFRFGVSLVSTAEAANELTALAVTNIMTMGVLIQPVGQVVFTSTLLTYKVPARVTKLSGVFMGASGGGGHSNGATNPGGGGGGAALLYFNDYPVNPGDTIAITIETNNVNFTQPGQDGTNGGTLTVKHNNLTLAIVYGGMGGKASGSRGLRGSISSVNSAFATYATQRLGNNGADGSGGGGGGMSANYRSVTPTSAAESLDGSIGSNQVYGVGGSGGTNFGGAAIQARVRLIWGTGRSYPDNALDAAVVN